MASAAVMAITKRSISGSEKTVPAKDQQLKQLRCAAIVPSYGPYVAYAHPPGRVHRAVPLGLGPIFFSRRQVQCGLTQTFDIALAGLRKLDDLPGDHFVGEVAWAFNSRTNGFECDAHETRGLRIEVLVA